MSAEDADRRREGLEKILGDNGAKKEEMVMEEITDGERIEYMYKMDTIL